MLKYYSILFIVMNLLSFLMMAHDKERSKNYKRRVSEFSFFVLTVLGGFSGIFIGAKVFRHKTMKHSFHLKIILGMLIHFSVLYLSYTFILSDLY